MDVAQVPDGTFCTDVGNNQGLGFQGFRVSGFQGFRVSGLLVPLRPSAMCAGCHRMVHETRPFAQRAPSASTGSAAAVTVTVVSLQ